MAWPFLCRVQQAQLEQPRPREVKGLAKGVRTWASYLHHNNMSGIFVMFVSRGPSPKQSLPGIHWDFKAW